MYKNIVFFLGLLCLAGCAGQREKIVVVDRVPAKQIVIPRLSELHQAAAQGDAPAQFTLGALYAEGRGVPKSHRKAMEYWKLAAVQGHALAQYGLGWMYFYGEGVMTDIKEGCRWMQRAGSQGVEKAQTHYSRFCVSVP